MIKRLFHRRSFQFKLFLTYTVFILFIMSGLFVAFYLYNSWLFQRNAMQNQDQLVQLTSDQLDANIREMDSISIELLSNDTIINALSRLKDAPSEAVRYSIYNEVLVAMQQVSLTRFVLTNQTYTISIFTESGFFASNLHSFQLDTDASRKIPEISWISKAKANKGGKLLLPIHENDWVENHEQVFSLVRTIQTPLKELGFLEIQQSASTIAQISNIKSVGPLNVLIADNDQNLIYSNNKMTPELFGYYQHLIQSNGADTVISHNPHTENTEIVSYATSDYSGWTLITVENKKYLTESLNFIRSFTFVGGILLLLVTFFTFYIFSIKLTQPLKKLKRAIEQTNISNLPEAIDLQLDLKNEHNEIEILSRSFQKMRTKLNDSIIHEIEFRSLQLEARFSALQAHINPHFLFNMLTVLANIGDEAGLKEVSSICRQMARNLRYSSSKINTKVSIQEEIAHVADYLLLMQKRFESRLAYSIHVEESMMSIPMPKLIMQPLVENAIHHGFTQTSSVMQIEITGEIQEDRWYIYVKDNGSGFEEELLLNLKNKLDKYAADLYAGKASTDLAIGGMGLVNTFARLQLFFGNEFKFEISNHPEGGACVTLSGAITPVRGNGIVQTFEGDRHV